VNRHTEQGTSFTERGKPGRSRSVGYREEGGQVCRTWPWGHSLFVINKGEEGKLSLETRQRHIPLAFQGKG